MYVPYPCPMPDCVELKSRAQNNVRMMRVAALVVAIVAMVVGWVMAGTTNNAYVCVVNTAEEAVLAGVWKKTLSARASMQPGTRKTMMDRIAMYDKPGFEFLAVVGVGAAATMVEEILIEIGIKVSRESMQEIINAGYYDKLFFVHVQGMALATGGGFDPFTHTSLWTQDLFNGFLDPRGSFRHHTHVAISPSQDVNIREQQAQLIHDLFVQGNNTLAGNISFAWQHIHAIDRGPRDAVISAHNDECTATNTVIYKKKLLMASHITFFGTDWPNILPCPELKEYLRLWLALAFSPSASRTRLLLATFVDHIPEKMFMATVQSAHDRYAMGKVSSQKYYDVLVAWVRESSTSTTLFKDAFPTIWRQGFATIPSFQEKYKMFPTLPKADPQQTANVARALHSNWIKTLDIEKTCHAFPQDSHVLPYIKVAQQTSTSQRVLYALITYGKAHATKAKRMLETCLSRVDSLVVLSDTNDSTIGSIKFHWDGPQSYDNLWNVMKGAHAYLGRNYFSHDDRNAFDWLALVTDDSVVIPENVQKLVQQLVDKHTRETPMFVGKRLSATMADRTGDLDFFVSGGPLRLFNRAAIHKLTTVMNDWDWCGDDAYGYAEDVHTTRCFAQIGIVGMDTSDAQGRDAFHAFPPEMMFYEGNDWSNHPSWKMHGTWYPSYVYPPLLPVGMKSSPRMAHIGHDVCCQMFSVTFHLYLKDFNPKGHDESLYGRLFVWWYGYCGRQERQEYL